MISFMTQQIIRERPALIDDGRGNEVADWSDKVVSPISGCSVQPGASQEDLLNRAGSKISWTVLAPAHADVTYGDRIILGGLQYRLIGEPEHWPSPTGGLDHIKILLERWSG